MSRRGVLAALSMALALTSSGCALIRRATGPELSERGLPIVPATAVSDHRAKDRLLFLVFGDGGTGKSDQRKVAALMARECEARGGCDFALMAGDNIYIAGVRAARMTDGDGVVMDPGFVEKFEIPYEPLGRTDFWAVAGNHDWYTRHSVDQQVLYSNVSPRWRMLAHDYEIPHLPQWIRMYGLDTTKLEEGLEDGQIERAAEALCGRGGWKLLLGHHPVYSSGKHAGPKGELSRIKNRILEPLIERCGVHFYLSGHDHHQEHLSAPAFDQIVQGAAGKLRRVRTIEEREPGVRQLAAWSRFGFALVQATAERLEIRFFGYGAGQAPGELYCRVFDSKDFADPERRSKPCRQNQGE